MKNKINKKAFESPEILVVSFNTEDVLTTSGGLVDGGSGSGDGGNWGDWGA